jgi:Cu/Ag efflux protein CusF
MTMRKLVLSAAFLAVFAFACTVFAEKCSGTIKRVDIGTKRIVVNVSSGKDMNLTVAADAKITLNGKRAKLEDLQAGDKVECHYGPPGATSVVATRQDTRPRD